MRYPLIVRTHVWFITTQKNGLTIGRLWKALNHKLNPRMRFGQVYSGLTRHRLRGLDDPSSIFGYAVHRSPSVQL